MDVREWAMEAMLAGDQVRIYDDLDYREEINNIVDILGCTRMQAAGIVARREYAGYPQPLRGGA